MGDAWPASQEHGWQGAEELYTHPADQVIAGEQNKLIQQLNQSIHRIEKVVLAAAD